MAANLTIMGSILGPRIVEDTTAGATVQYNVTVGSHGIKAVKIDNTANVAASYLKFWNLGVGVTLGTTNPVMVLIAPASKVVQYNFNNIPFSVAIDYACVTSAGTPGVTAPTSAVPIVIIAG